jgi:predicted nucleic acid-binding protein
LDTNVMVAAIRSDAGASRRLLRAGLERQYALLLSVPLVIEYEAVMTRPEHLAASGLSASDVGVLLDAVVLVGEPVELAYLWRPQLTDPDDDMVLEAAVNGRADRLVTFNTTDFVPAAHRFGITVATPRQTLARMEEIKQ